MRHRAAPALWLLWMMWQILPHATACIAAGRLVLLDLRRDRYFLLEGDAAAEPAAWLCRGGATPAAFADVLRQNHIWRPADGPLNRADTIECPAMVTASAASDSGRVSPGTVASTAAAVAMARLSLSTRPLWRIAARSRTRKGAATDKEQLRVRAARFERARRWIPVLRNCLLDSLALNAWLGAPGNVRIVFGVIAHPFEAHCWVQADDMLLSDTLDHVSRFTPILAL